ncbi:hypothetical protein ACFPM0_26565 [Pseudonocardia sulfidoxydans]|uniref:hypothetical protein n=1 Tax=Pseudonocardia sulfidoxydans TaxID=54011 RepID=UPI00360BA9F7
MGGAVAGAGSLLQPDASTAASRTAASEPPTVRRLVPTRPIPTAVGPACTREGVRCTPTGETTAGLCPARPTS